MKKIKVIGLFLCILSLTLGCTYLQKINISEIMAAKAWQKIPTVCSTEILPPGPGLGIYGVAIYQNYFVVAAQKQNRLVIYSLTQDKKSVDSQVVNLPLDENGSFKTFAINENYLAVGYPRSNLVVVYRPNDQGIWQKTKEILPPKNSLADKLKIGFGRTLKLEKSLLVIGAMALSYELSDENKVSNQKYEIDRDLFDHYEWTYPSSLYKTNLDLNDPVKRIDSKSQNAFWGGSVALDKGRIAFDLIREKQPEHRRSSREVNLLLDDGKLQTFLAPEYPKPNSSFGISLELKNNLLLVGAVTWKNQKDPTLGALLYDVEKIEAKPKFLTIPKSITGTTLALSEDWAAIGFHDSRTSIWSESQPIPRTLIKQLNSDAIAVIDGDGFLTLEGDILLRQRYPSPGGYVPDLFQVFQLNKQGEYYLLEQRSGVGGATLKNSLFGIVEYIEDGTQACLKQLP